MQTEIYFFGNFVFYWQKLNVSVCVCVCPYPHVKREKTVLSLWQVQSVHFQCITKIYDCVLNPKSTGKSNIFTVNNNKMEWQLPLPCACIFVSAWKWTQCHVYETSPLLLSRKPLSPLLFWKNHWTWFLGPVNLPKDPAYKPWNHHFKRCLKVNKLSMMSAHTALDRNINRGDQIPGTS